MLTENHVRHDHPSTTFQVPDGSDDGSDIDDDNSNNDDRSVKEGTEPTPSLPGQRMARIIDLTLSGSMEAEGFVLGSTRGRAHDRASSQNYIDLSSSPAAQSPLDSAFDGYESDPEDVFVQPHVPVTESVGLPMPRVDYSAAVADLHRDHE